MKENLPDPKTMQNLLIPSSIQRCVIVIVGNDLEGRSTDPANLDAGSETVPAVIPYTAEIWIEKDTITLYKRTDQTKPMARVHTFQIKEMETFARFWDVMFRFNDPLFRGSYDG